MDDKGHILIVENEKQIAHFMKMELEHEGYDCDIERNGARALDRIGQHHYDLILLSILLPDMDGLTICSRTRSVSDIPIIMVSSKDDINTKVLSFDLGANDYITKPFNSKELFARIRGLLRKKGLHRSSREDVLHLQDMILYLTRHEVVLGATHVILTKKEFDLLAYLIRNKDVVLTRERIVEEVWGYDYVGDTNIVDVYIRYIREKLGIGRRQYICTVRGIGYVAKG